MKIALDYDKTYNVDPFFWDCVIEAALECGHQIRIVTVRGPVKDNIDDKVHPLICDDIIYCNGIAKKHFCTHLADDEKGWMPDVWIDDRPESILNNGPLTPQQLAEWRAGPEHDA